MWDVTNDIKNDYPQAIFSDLRVVSKAWAVMIAMRDGLAWRCPEASGSLKARKWSQSFKPSLRNPLLYFA